MNASLDLKIQIIVIMMSSNQVYTLSQLENDHDVSVYSGGRRLLIIACATCVISHAFKKKHRGLAHKGCVLQRVSLGALIDVTVVPGMRQSICNVDNN